jgi:Protein of unknown function (DUF3102)
MTSTTSAATDVEALLLIPKIKEAHEKTEAAQQTSYNQALEYAIKAGELLTAAKEAVGHGGWSAWRQQNLANIPQTTASLYMRLAEHKEKFKETRISNSVADLKSQGKLSLRAAASLLPKRPQTLAQKAAIKARREAIAEAKKNNEGIAKEYINGLAADELVTVLKEVHDTDYLRELSGAVTRALTLPGAPPTRRL